MNVAFWYSLTAKQQQVLLSMYDEPCPIHPRKIEEKTAEARTTPADTLEDLKTLRSMGLIYHTGPFWNLTREGMELVRGRAGR